MDIITKGWPINVPRIIIILTGLVSLIKGIGTKTIIQNETITIEGVTYGTAAQAGNIVLVDGLVMVG